ncbi:MAG TPA: hypothetical protein VGK39_01315 [Cyclobacteriaceae bacterium]
MSYLVITLKSNKESVDRIFFVIKLTSMGLLSGVMGMVAFAVLIPPTDLYADIRNALLAGFFSMLAAVWVNIYRHSGGRKKQTNNS